jgi:hypothetical protein
MQAAPSGRSPEQMGGEELRRYQLYLRHERKLAWAQWNETEYESTPSTPSSASISAATPNTTAASFRSVRAEPTRSPAYLMISTLRWTLQDPLAKTRGDERGQRIRRKRTAYREGDSRGRFIPERLVDHIGQFFQIVGAQIANKSRITSLMTPEEFREYGHQLIDWLADYQLLLPVVRLWQRLVQAKSAPNYPRMAGPS